MTAENDLDDLRPRRYQEEVFRQAQQGNVVAALDTGSGKTYISTLLIKWIASQEDNRGKAIIFLVPKVALVEQQGDFISSHSSLRVVKVYGQNIDLTDREGWEENFRNNDVFVMTAQIFLNFLTHSIWSIDKVSLIVLDECHHARKNHPYNSIMKEHLRFPFAQRPKIFGMTASPIWNTRDAAGSLSTLEANLDAKVVGVRAHTDELASHTPKPTEAVRIYLPAPDIYNYPSPFLWTCLSVFDKEAFSALDVSWLEIERRYHVTFHNLGPYCASFYLFSELHPRVKALVEQTQWLSTDSDEDESISREQNAKPSSTSLDLIHILDVLSDYLPYFSQESDFSTSASIEWFTPKVKTLVEVISAHISPTFQGIVFVDQRQIATCLSLVLPNIAELKGLVRCADLLGNAGGNNERTGTSLSQHEIVKMFRKGDINLLIATSVAEEGLDFPACDVVVRFDPLQHMVGYLQSRGRARNKTSNYIIMAQKDDEAYKAKYQTYLAAEPALKTMYQGRHALTGVGREEGEEDDYVHPDDLAARERYLVSSTGAFVNYDNSLALINQLCSMIPRDKFTSVHTPKYAGDFQSTMHLPASLPLPPGLLVFTGPKKHSKREAKRAVAFMAVKSLHALQVFDDYLLPAGSRKKARRDGDGYVIRDVRNVPVVLEVSVRDPWCMSKILWIHTVCIEGRPVAGIVTGTRLPMVSLGDNQSIPLIETRQGEEVLFGLRDEGIQRRMMEEYTRLGIHYRNTAREFNNPLSLFLVPITARCQPDFEAISCLLSNPRGRQCWEGVRDEMYGRVMVTNVNQYGRPLLLHRVRDDLTVLSAPATGSREEGFATYRDYFVDHWTRKTRPAHVPSDGPLLEVSHLTRFSKASYTIGTAKLYSGAIPPSEEVVLVPQGCCSLLDFSFDVRRAYDILPSLCRRITDLYRVREAKFRLGLPPIDDDLMVQALTIPSAGCSFNNQRLETLGDAVLEVCTTVHLFNKFPHLHEGQLHNLRRGSISNHYLLGKALDYGVEHFISSENGSVRGWPYILPETQLLEPSERYVSRKFPRRSLQDCMEAIIGASFLSGGLPMALHTGTALGLTFGGQIPWPLRYEVPRAKTRTAPISPLFSKLEDALGYKFRDNSVLVEAVTHPSFSMTCETASYQRMEFLGDAILDLVVIKYLYDKFPQATSEQLARPRQKAVCAPALASLAVRKLHLHDVMLINNVDLSIAISDYVPRLQSISGPEMVRSGWRYDPPKAISDVFESVVAAVLIDSGYNYDRTAAVVEHVMDDLLAALSPSVAKDPVSELMEFVPKHGCRLHVNFSKEPGRNNREGIAVRIHGTLIAGPIVSASMSVAKALAAERSLSILKDQSSELSFSKVCTCGAVPAGQDAFVNAVEEDSDPEVQEEDEVLQMLLIPEGTTNLAF